ncbi:MAG TPA: energy transducer TonB [Opitutaceae bacterium]|nr:energy transducer TonB [Opitutaceae bacterium]
MKSALFAALPALAVLAGNAAAQPPEAGGDFQSAQIIETVEPYFPVTLYREYEQGGHAGIEISVEADGRLSDWLPVRYTDKRFAELAIDALKQWQFKPARWHGQAVPVCLYLDFDFRVHGVVIDTSRDEALTAYIRSMQGDVDAYHAYELKQLDRIPVPENAPAPHYPHSLAERGIGGTVTVAFYVDEKGAVRMVSVEGRPAPELADLASEAVSHWKFEPPTVHGRPVLARLSQEFHFRSDR